MTFLQRCIQLFWPRWCLCCGAVGPLLCDRCADSFTALQRQDPSCRSFCSHQGAGRALLLRAKYAPDPALARRLGRLMAQRLPYFGRIVLWAPPHSKGEGTALAALAHAFAREAGLPVGPALRWRVTRDKQTSVNSERQREAFPFDAFECPSPLPAEVIVIDDVLTTGATMRALVAACRAAGAQKVCALTWSARPKK